MRATFLTCAVALLLAWMAAPSFGCTTDTSPSGVVRAYADALDSADGARAASYLAPGFDAEAQRWLPVYARVIERYNVEILQETIDAAGVLATVKVRERADLVVGGEDFTEVLFTLKYVDGRWKISAVADVTAAAPASATPPAP